MRETGTRTLALLLAVGLAGLLFARLGDRGLLETSEARYAETAREMYLSGDWITPRFFGLKHFHKPPLTYWITCAGYGLFGVNEFGARFWLAVAALAAIGVTGWLGAALFTPRAGLLAALILATCPLFAAFGRVLTTDMFLTLASTAAVAAFWAGWTRRAGFVPMWLALAAGFMLKGPVALALVFAAALPVLALDRKRWRELFPIRGLVAFALLALPWFAVICWDNPGLFSRFVFYETVDRLTTTVHGRLGAPHYFVGVFLLGTFPWSLAAPAALRDAWRRRRGTRGAEGPGDRQGSSIPESLGPGTRHPISGERTLLLAGWFVIPFVLFSASRSKLLAYILPILPASSLVLAAWFDRLLEGEFEDRWATVPALLAGLTLAAAVPLAWWLGGLEPFSELGPQLVCAALAFALWAAFAIEAERARRAGLLLAGTALAALVFPALIAPFGDRASGEYKSVRPLVQRLRALSPPGAPVILCRLGATSVPFYLGRAVYTFECDHDLRFEADPAAAARWHFHDIARLLEVMAGGPAFLIADDESVRHVEDAMRARGAGRLYPLGRTWKYNLLTSSREIASAASRSPAK